MITLVPCPGAEITSTWSIKASIKENPIPDRSPAVSVVNMGSMALDGPEFTVEVRDDGVGIGDVARAMAPTLTTDAAGERSGMGFSFMEALMDQGQVIAARGKGTTVNM